jgi:hypothetical protein
MNVDYLFFPILHFAPLGEGALFLPSQGVHLSRARLRGSRGPREGWMKTLYMYMYLYIFPKAEILSGTKLDKKCTILWCH